VAVAPKPQVLVQRSCADSGITLPAHFQNFVKIFFLQKIVHDTL
jgi:hypothetical protein